MIRKLLLIGFCLLNIYSLAAQTNTYDSILFEGRWRTYLTHLPTGYNTSGKYPLVLAFHGGSPLGYQSIQFQSKLTQKSDSAGFIVVYPEGVKVAGNRTWNAGGCCAPATTLNINDVGFVNALLNNLISKNSIDTARVYATGFSNGALLCYRLATQLTYRFAAIAPVAGDLVYYPWNPTRAIPIISFHSYKDQNVKYFGGITTGATGTWFPPQDSVFNIISTNYKCSIKKDTLFHNALTYDHFKYSNCNCNAVIEQYVSYDGEHSWPGGLASGGTTVSNQFSATYLMWQFFQKYTTACQKTRVKNIPEKSQIQAFPNPFQDKIQLTGNYDNVQCTLINGHGQVVWCGKNIEQQNFSHLSKGLYLLQINTLNIRLLKN
jgi:polyhydroxybutyrate depolymerase